MRTGLLAFQSAIAATLAINANTYLISTAKIDESFALLLSAALSIVATNLLASILDSALKNSGMIRRLFDPLSKFEGAWIITIDDLPSRPYSYAAIEYNREAGGYVYYGNGFRADGKMASTWSSAELTFDLSKNELRYFADAQLADEKGEMLKNWGRITFSKESFGANFSRGKGFFIDFGTNFLKSHFFMDRMTKEDLMELINKDLVKSHDDMSDLIHAYHLNKLERKGGFVDRHSYPLPFPENNGLRAAGNTSKESH